LQQGIDGNLSLDQSKRCTWAVMNSTSKRKMPVLSTSNVQLVRIGKLVGVAVGRAKANTNVLTFLDSLIADFFIN
jgi:hypothetical protein